MQTIVRCALLVGLVAVTGVVQAEPKFDPAGRAKTIAPFIDGETIAVVHVDLTRIEVDPLLDKLMELIPEARPGEQDARAEMKEKHAQVLKAGMRELYAVVSLADLPRRAAFFVIIPDADAVDRDALVASFFPQGSRGREEVIEPVQGALFFGVRPTLERVKAMEPDARPELTRAFEAAGDTAVQALLLPPKHSRRVIEEMMPTLPEEVGGGPSTILTRGLLWAAVGADPPPKMSLRVVIQSEDTEAAAALRGKWLDLVGFLSKNEQAKRLLRKFDQAVALMTPSVEGDRIVLNLSEQDRSIQALLAAVTPPLEEARAAARRTQSTNYLKQIALAMHNYYDKWKSFPAVGNTDASGKPLLSWRVHILPFVEQQKLYDQFHLNEPWDSEHNRKLIEKMPATYHCPASKLRQKEGLSTYRVVVGEGTVFTGGQGIMFKDITDGTSNTIMVVEVDDEHAVIWTKPEGLPFDPENPLKGLGGQFGGGFDAAFCDGSVHFISETIDKENLRRLLLRNDGNPVSKY